MTTISNMTSTAVSQATPPGLHDTPMINTAEASVQSNPNYDVKLVQSELEATRSAFHSLLVSHSEGGWRRRSLSSVWTVAEVFVHLTWALEYLPREVARARQGKGMFNFPKRLADPVSFWYIRLIARNSTPSSIRRRYDAAMDAAIEALQTAPDSDWERGAEFYGEGFYTVADLFRVPAEHFAEHTVGM
jgi:DinB superfamily